MPNVERGLEVCAEVGLRGCKKCPFKGSQYCTSLLAQGALTMIKGLKDDYEGLDKKRPIVNDELDTLIKGTVNALNAGDATCKVEMTKSDAEKLASFLSTSLSVSKRVPSFAIPWEPVNGAGLLAMRLERAIRRSFSVLGHADPEETGNTWCQCLMCSTKRKLHDAYYAYVDAHGEEAARAELNRVIRMRDIENGDECQPTVEAYPYSTEDVIATNSDSEESQSNTERNVESHDEPSNAEPSHNGILDSFQRLMRRGAQRYVNVRNMGTDTIDVPTQRSDR